MKFVVFLAIAACALYFTNAVPIGDVDVVDIELVAPLDEVAPTFDEVGEPEEHSRQKRATCDLLSAFGVNNSACAAHCVLRGNRGGYCNSKAVCICRK